MTNPYQGVEYAMQPEDYLPAEEQIKPTDPRTLKGLMEVWRDTANQLNAEKVLAEKAHKDFTSMHEKYMNELEEKLKLEEELRKEKELKDLAVQGLNGFREQLKDEKEHLEKVRRHRDELAEMVKKARESRNALNDWIESYDIGMAATEPIAAIRTISHLLATDLGAADA